MRKIITFWAVFSFFGMPAFASEWNYISSAGNNDAAYYFDAESVSKNSGTVTVWIKKVQIDKPDDDGSWASALNWKFNCQKRTIQLLSWSSYESNGKFIKSNSNISKEMPIAPDSIGDGIHKIVCMAEFPKNTPNTNGHYFKIEDNDVFAATKRLTEFKNSFKDNAPK